MIPWPPLRLPVFRQDIPELLSQGARRKGLLYEVHIRLRQAWFSNPYVTGGSGQPNPGPGGGGHQYVCYAQDARGQTYTGTSPDYNAAAYQALSACQTQSS